MKWSAVVTPLQNSVAYYEQKMGTTESSGFYSIIHLWSGMSRGFVVGQILRGRNLVGLTRKAC